MERKTLYFGIFLLFLIVVIILGFNSYMNTPKTYNNGNISFQYTSNFQNSSELPELYGNSFSWQHVDTLDSNATEVSIEIDKDSNNGSDIKTLGKFYEQYFRDMGDEFVSSSEYTNPNGVHMWQIVHKVQDINQSYLYEDTYFLQGNNVYSIQIIGSWGTDASVQKVANMVFNSTKVLQ
jgi:hypothetical protein